MNIDSCLGGIKAFRLKSSCLLDIVVRMRKAIMGRNYPNTAQVLFVHIKIIQREVDLQYPLFKGGQYEMHFSN